ncbi:MAG: hypothetical protein JKY03_14065, partial [Aureispira sp.]|nr:hypothetical protein [Aureispira sp.]
PLLLLFGAITIYQYVQYQEQYEALKTAARNSQVSTAIPEPIDAIAAEYPPKVSYYTHHQELSIIVRYNPLLRATIERKLHFYDCTKYNMALLDFYNLLNYRERMLIQAEPTDQKRIEEEMKEYSEQLCTRWEAFAQHLQQTYPNTLVAVGLNNLCAASIIHNYKQDDILDWMVDPIKK